MKKYIFFYSIVCVSLFGDIDQMRHIPYLCRKGDLEKAIDTYLDLSKQGHQNEILREIAINVLEDGCKTNNLEKQLITLYGIGTSKLSDQLPFLKKCIKSSHPNVQLAAIYLLGEFHDDSVDAILVDAMSSPYFPIRMEALYRLCMRKSRHALSYLESLRNLVPDEYSFFFPDFYAMIGSTDAISGFKKLFSSPHLDVRIATILSSAKFGRDDLLPMIRIAASHSNPAEQEAAATSLGFLNDLNSIEVLKRLSDSSYEDVRLSAYLSLIKLGHHQYEIEVKKLALKGNPFAIYVLKDIPDTNAILYELLHVKEPTIALNATVALLFKKDDRVMNSLLQLLVKGPQDTGYGPIFSPGKSFFAWKGISMGLVQAKYKETNIGTVTLQFKENLLIQALELSEHVFLKIAEDILENNIQSLIPVTVRLMENIPSEKTLSILRKYSQKFGNPLIRGYCLLSLYRIGYDDIAKKQFLDFISANLDQPLIQFRPMLERTHDRLNQSFELTPEEHSRLLLESYEALSQKRDPQTIDLILLAFKKGHPDNRPALAGLLLNAIQ